MDVRDLLTQDLSKLSQEERDILVSHLTGGKTVKAKSTVERVIREDVKIRCDKFAVKDNDGEEIAGAFREFFYLVSEEDLTPGAKLWVKTRRPWPSHVMVGMKLGERDGKKLYAYDRLKSDGTKRVD
jgi:predicted thioesterase